MADLGIYTKNADIQARAGSGANATAKATAATDIYVLNVESIINVLTRYNWTDAFTAGLNADVQGILTDAGASMCAMLVINFDTSGYVGSREAETKLDFLRDRFEKDIAQLKDIKARTFILGA